MSKVRFNDVDEYLEEMSWEASPYGGGGPQPYAVPIKRKIVRLSKRWTPSKVTPNIRLVSIISGFEVKGDLIELEFFVGDDWGPEFEPSKATHEKARLIAKVIEDHAKGLGLDVRAGAFE